MENIHFRPRVLRGDVHPTSFHCEPAIARNAREPQLYDSGTALKFLAKLSLKAMVRTIVGLSDETALPGGKTHLGSSGTSA